MAAFENQFMSFQFLTPPVVQSTRLLHSSSSSSLIRSKSAGRLLLVFWMVADDKETTSDRPTEEKKKGGKRKETSEKKKVCLGMKGPHLRDECVKGGGLDCLLRKTLPIPLTSSEETGLCVFRFA